MIYALAPAFDAARTENQSVKLYGSEPFCA